MNTSTRNFLLGIPTRSSRAWNSCENAASAQLPQHLDTAEKRSSAVTNTLQNSRETMRRSTPQKNPKKVNKASDCNWKFDMRFLSGQVALREGCRAPSSAQRRPGFLGSPSLRVNHSPGYLSIFCEASNKRSPTKCQKNMPAK